MENKKKYNLSFDIGTNSVGWAVTDMEIELLKFKNKNMWGVRLFEQGETAKARRLSRNTRRRYLRRRHRIELLRSLLEDTVKQVDDTFFIRMDEMTLWAEDKSFLSDEQKAFGNQSTLFMDKDFTDADYYEKFKTIYHLREFLMETTEKADIRLVYLAIHHILKYRGNFIREGMTLTASKDLKGDIKAVFELLEEHTQLSYNELLIENLENVLTDKKKSKKEKAEEFLNLLKAENKDLSKEAVAVINELAKAIVGLKANYSKLFFEDSVEDGDGKDISVAFSDNKYEEVAEKLENILGEKFYSVEILKNLNSGIILNDILKGEEYISKAMCALYRKHGEDLKVLKRLIKEEVPQAFKTMFKTNESNTYGDYINNGKCDIKEFYKKIKEEISKVGNKKNKDFKYINDEIDNERFLLKINSKNNGAIPYQLHLAELERIIENQGKFYPVLVENKDKIKSILEFRIPYYVGPLNPYFNPDTRDNKGFAWLVRKSNEKIYPWNFAEVVDIDESAEKFIKRMRNTCSYLGSEYEVLPKNSLLYSKYELLNELNKIRINGELIPLNIKQHVLDDLFLNQKNIKEGAFKNWLVKNNYYPKPDMEIRGYQKDKEFASSLSPYIDFISILSEGKEKLTIEEKKDLIASSEEMIEEIIKWISLFEDKKILKRKVINKYKILTDGQVTKVLKLRYKGWGALSKELLKDLSIINEDGKRVTIISQMENTNQNFMQVINDRKLGFDKLIEEKRPKSENGMISLETIEKLHGSPAIKKAIWQTVKLTEEIVNIMGYPPENFYIEFAREDQESKRTNSRKAKLEKAYKELKETTDIYNKTIADELKKEKNISTEKLFLYYMQNGKCMYSGESLDIEELSNYEVDHIIPQSYIFDDSFENKVLVKRIENQNKTDKLTLSKEIRERMYPYWSKLKKVGLISQKKFDSLTKVNYDERDIENFLNRQLVETRQITKHVANILSDCYKDSKIVAIKAGLTSLYRKKYKIPKLRELNDLHHAHDAYLASVIGNFIGIRYPKLDGVFNYKDFLRVYKNQKTEKNKYGFVITAMDNNVKEGEELLWDASKEILKVVRILDYKGCNVTKKIELQTGNFYNMNLIKSTKNGSSNNSLVEQKKGMDPSKYGGYENIQSAYFVAVEHKVKKKLKKEIVTVPIMVDELIATGQLDLETYLGSHLGLKDYRILRNRICKYQKISLKDTVCYIVGEGEVANGTQLLLNLEEQRALEKILEKNPTEVEEAVRENIIDLWIEKSKKFYKLYQSEIESIENYKAYGYFNKLKLTREDEEKARTQNDLIKAILTLTSSAPRMDLSEFNKNIEKDDFKQCKLSSAFGRKRITLNLNEVVFIDESITGLYSRKYSL